jgi:hypothetical protein
VTGGRLPHADGPERGEDLGGLVDQLSVRAPEDDRPGGDQVSLPGDVVLPVLDLHVEPAVHLEDHDLAAGQPPLGIGVARAS